MIIAKIPRNYTDTISKGSSDRRRIKVIRIIIIMVIAAGGIAEIPNAALGSTEIPKGYLVPRPNSIPPGLYPYPDPGASDSFEGYSISYTATDHTSRLTVSENVETAAYNYDSIIQNYQKAEQYVRKNKLMEKQRDLQYMGLRGELFRTKIGGVMGYDCYLKDGDKLFRIVAQDGPVFQFSEGMVIDVVNGLERQD